MGLGRPDLQPPWVEEGLWHGGGVCHWLCLRAEPCQRAGVVTREQVDTRWAETGAWKISLLLYIRDENTRSHKKLYVNVSHATRDHPDWKQPERPSPGERTSTVHTYYRILLSNRKQQSAETCNPVDVSQRHADSNKPLQGTVGVHLHEMPGKCKAIGITGQWSPKAGSGGRT